VRGERNDRGLKVRYMTIVRAVTRAWAMAIRRNAVAAIAVVALGLTASAALAAARLSAPATARVGGRITVTARGLKPGSYRLFLEFTALAPPGVSATGCLAEIGTPSRAVAGRVSISGVLPRRLACHQAEGPTEGYVTTKAGHYALDFGGFLPPAGFKTSQSFLRRAIQLTTGR
jgi:hypothetical protein